MCFRLVQFKELANVFVPILNILTDCGLRPVSYSYLRFAKNWELSQLTFQFQERNDTFFSCECSFSDSCISISCFCFYFPSIGLSSIHLQDAEHAAIHTVNVSLDQSPNIKAKNHIKLNAQWSLLLLCSITLEQSNEILSGWQSCRSTTACESRAPSHKCFQIQLNTSWCIKSYPKLCSEYTYDLLQWQEV